MAAININKEQFHSLIAGDKPVLVDFWAPWCSYCRRIGPAYEKVAEQYGESIVVGKVNIDEQPQIAHDEQIEVKRGEGLTPELRIYAFVKLGVVESTRIAQILHYSVSTIYAYRNKMRNKAINRDTFEADVASIRRR